MATVVDASQVDVESAVQVDPPAPARPVSRAASVLDNIRAKASRARENLWVDVPLPDTVPGNLSLRLGVPVDVAELAFFPAGGRSGEQADRDIRDLASNMLGVVADGEIVEGLSAQDIAAAYAEALYGAARPIADDEQAVRELHSAGTPPQVNAAALRSNATLYRVWSTDPTPPRTSIPSPSE